MGACSFPPLIFELFALSPRRKAHFRLFLLVFFKNAAPVQAKRAVQIPCALGSLCRFLICLGLACVDSFFVWAVGSGPPLCRFLLFGYCFAWTHLF